MNQPAAQPASAPAAPTPRLIAWELTRRCVLSCRHCRASATEHADADELTTAETAAAMRNVASFAKPTLILTGGEPLLRADVYELAALATSLGLPVVLATCGTLLDLPACRRLIDSGVRRISVSIDGPDAASHDAFRGQSGALEATLRGLEAARGAGLEFQVNATICRLNLAQLPALLELSVRLGARAFNPFLLVPTGRGADLGELELSAGQYEQTLEWLAQRQGRNDIVLRVTCAPQYQRILRQRGLPGDPRDGGGCLAGRSFAFISHTGVVQPCGFLPIECGQLRRGGMDFRGIWTGSSVLAALRDPSRLGGRCGGCEFQAVCGGCRARAYAASGDFLGQDPRCPHEPKAGYAAGGRASDDAGFVAKAMAAPGLDDLDRGLLTAVQAEFPVDPQPMQALAARLGVSAQQVLDRLRDFRRRGLIRRIGGVFDAARLGLASTLAAACVPPEKLDRAAELICAHPGVTHCYQRDHMVSLWFTLTAASGEQLEQILTDLSRETGLDLWSLPALRTYKISAQFPLAQDRGPTGQPIVGQVCPTYGRPGTMREQQVARPTAPPMAGDAEQPTPAVRLDDDQRALARLVQDDLPLCDQPYLKLARQLGRTQEWVLEQLRQWLSTGLLRRLAAVARHRQLGFTANAMVAFDVPPDRLDQAGHRLAGRDDVTHCYQRAVLPDWPYNLYAMFHARDNPSLRAAINQVSGSLGVERLVVLNSVREFKKTSMAYF